jgi:hypothetical protein
MTEQLYTTNNQVPPVQPPAVSNKPEDQSLPTSGSSSAIQTNSNQQQLPQSALPQGEPKLKRIKVLRLLAIKAASILEWDLLKFEKE